MRPKRLLPLVVFLAFTASIALVPGASAGNFDEQRMGCAGEDPAVCPTGTTGQEYTLPIELLGDEDEACAVYTHASGTLPPGLAVYSDEAKIKGTPTQAGTFDFYLNVAYTRETSCPFKNPSDDRFVISITQGAPVTPPPPPKPKLVIGPEQSGVRNATVGASYTLPMTANLSDAKRWSISSGALPPGLTIGSTDGVIAGTPTTAGSYSFTVQATIDERSDTKTLTIVVREPLVISAPERFDARHRALAEVGVFFDEVVTVVGGTGSYTWTVTGALPDGLEFDAVTGTISGEPELAGSYRFGLVAIDTEGRRAVYPGRIVVVKRVAIVTKRLRNGRVGRVYRSKLAKIGGAAPIRWKIKRGPLPKGIRFDSLTGVFAGLPVKTGVWLVTVEVLDGLRVKAVATVTVAIAPRLKTR